MKENSPLPSEECDICIVGTGAAGGILAYRLAMAGRNVLSIEQGGPIQDNFFSNDRGADELPHFGIFPEMKWPTPPAEGYLYNNAEAYQLYAHDDTLSTSKESATTFINRQVFRVNGRLNVWNAVALRMSPRDFQSLDHGDGDCNWPIRYSDLANHYTAAEKLIGVCGTKEGLESLPDGDFLPPLPMRPIDVHIKNSIRGIRRPEMRAIPARKAVETRHDQPHHCRNCGECIYGCRYGSIYKFSSHLLPRIVNRPNYRIRYHVKVARLIRAPNSNAISSVECINTESNQRFLIHAKTFVLATGTIETPRILFNSADEQFPTGLANSVGLVGHYLQDKVRTMVAAPLLRFFGAQAKYDAECNDHLIVPRFLFDNTKVRGGFQAQVCHVLPRRPYYLEGFQPFPTWSRKWLAKKMFRSFVALLFMGKPEAKHSNRLLLGTERDVFGMRKVNVEYQFSDNDLRLRQEMIRYGKMILRKCSGYVTSVLESDTPGASAHHGGTCRMAAHRTEGVVDSELCSFDHPNLYLCDGSVMTEMSEKSLTLTIMALAERLATKLIAK